MPTRDEELEAFKHIDLPRFLIEACGFEIDPKSSSKNSPALKHADGSKLIVGMGHDLHYVFFDTHDTGNNGTILDLVMHREGKNLGQVRQVLRPWINCTTPLPSQPASSYVGRLLPVEKDHLAIRARLQSMQTVPGHHPYLTGERAIPPEILGHPRFEGCIFSDEHGNAVFPHEDEDGITGYEIRGPQFKGFAKNGTKGLWASGKNGGDTSLCIAESAISALSYAALHGVEKTRFVSISGQMNQKTQPPLLALAIQALPPGGSVIEALDNDQGGDRIASGLEGIWSGIQRPTIAFRRHSPQTAGQDWNNALRASVAKTEPGVG